jgi:hypothetical protein
MTVLDHTTAIPESLDADITAVLGGWNSLTTYLRDSGCPNPTDPAAIRSVLDTIDNAIDTLPDDVYFDLRPAISAIEQRLEIIAAERVAYLTEQIMGLDGGPADRDVALRAALEIVAYQPGIVIYNGYGSGFRYKPDGSIFEDTPFVAAGMPTGSAYGRKELGVNLTVKP